MLVLCVGSKLTRFSCGDRNWLFFRAGIKIDFVFVCRPKLLGFNVWIEIYLVFVCGPKMTWFWCGNRMTGFCVDGRNWLGFDMRTENHLVSVWESYLTSSLCGWSKLTWVQRGGLKLTWFQCGNEISVVWVVEIDLISVRRIGIDLDLSVEIGIDLMFVWWSKITCFWSLDEINSVLYRGIEIDFILEWGSKLTWCQWWDRK